MQQKGPNAQSWSNLPKVTPRIMSELEFSLSISREKQSPASCSFSSHSLSPATFSLSKDISNLCLKFYLLFELWWREKGYIGMWGMAPWCKSLWLHMSITGTWDFGEEPWKPSIKHAHCTCNSGQENDMTFLNLHSCLIIECSIKTRSPIQVHLFLVKYKYFQTCNPPRTPLISTLSLPLFSCFEIFELTEVCMYSVGTVYIMLSWINFRCSLGGCVIRQGPGPRWVFPGTV